MLLVLVASTDASSYFDLTEGIRSHLAKMFQSKQHFILTAVDVVIITLAFQIAKILQPPKIFSTHFSNICFDFTDIEMHLLLRETSLYMIYSQLILNKLNLTLMMASD